MAVKRRARTKGAGTRRGKAVQPKTAPKPVAKRSGAVRKKSGGKRAVRAGGGTSNATGRGKPKRAAALSSRRLSARDQAVEELGGRVKPGKVRLGGTRRLTPTKAGFRALKREIESVQKTITRKGAKPRAYSFQLSIRYRGADGRFKKLDKVEGVFPLKRSLSRRKKKGESQRAAFERITEIRIKAAVFRAIDRAEGVIGYTPAVQRALASGDRERITRAMRAFKKRRGVTFKVDVERHVTTGEAGHGKTSRVSGGAGSSGRKSGARRKVGVVRQQRSRSAARGSGGRKKR